MSDNGIIYAINRRGVKRPFTRIAWDLLGKNKEGWTEVKEQPITNVIYQKLQSRPNTGEQKIENVAKTKIQAEEPAGQKIENVLGNVVTQEPATEEVRQQFFAAAKGLNGGKIKDYFDSATPRIEYSKKSQPIELVSKLGEVLNYDIVALQKLFS